MTTTILSYLRSLLPNTRELLTPTLVPSWDTYSAADLRHDVVAGITVAAVLIPNTLAYALLAGLPPVMGLYAAFPAVAAAAVWGASRVTITAPVGVTSLLAATILSQYATVQTSEYITLAIALAVLTGLIQLGFGLARLGILTRLISQATLVGFTNAAALLIALSQLPTLLGISVTAGRNPFEALYILFVHIPQAHAYTALVGGAAILAVVLGRRYARALPWPLIVVCAGLLIHLSGILTPLDVESIGYIPAGLPQFSLDAFSYSRVIALFGQAFLLALVGYVSTYSLSNMYAKRAHERIDADKELVGQGFANIGAGLLGGFPVSGSLSVTALHAQSGARTRMSSLVAAATIFLALVCIAPFLAHIPRTILAGIVILSVLQLITVNEFRAMYSLSPSDTTIALVTTIVALLTRPDIAVIVGVALTVGYFIVRNMHVRLNEVALHKKHHSLWIRQGRTKEWTDEDVYHFPHTLIARLDSSLHFANADTLAPNIAARIAAHEREFGATLRAVVINCDGMNTLDLSGIESFVSLRDTLRDRGIVFAVMMIKDSALPGLTAAHFFDSVQYINGPHELREFCEEIEK